MTVQHRRCLHIGSDGTLAHPHYDKNYLLGHPELIHELKVWPVRKEGLATVAALFDLWERDRWGAKIQRLTLNDFTYHPKKRWGRAKTLMDILSNIQSVYDTPEELCIQDADWTFNDTETTKLMRLLLQSSFTTLDIGPFPSQHLLSVLLILPRTSITRLVLRNIQFDNNIADAVLSHGGLKYLEVQSFDSLKEGGSKRLFDRVRKHANLESLAFCNQISSDGGHWLSGRNGERLIRTVAKMGKLKHLTLDSCFREKDLENILPSLRSLDSLKIGWPNNIKYSRLVTHLHALGRSIGSLSELHLKFRIPLNTQIETLIAYNLAYGPRRLTIELDNIEQNGVPDLYSEERLLFREEVSRSNFLHEVKVNSLESLTLLNCHVPDKFASQLQLRCDTNKIQNSGLLSNRITPSIWPYALQQLTTETTHDALFYLIRRRHSDFVPSRMDRHSLITRTMSASVVADSSVKSDQMTMTTTTLSSRSSAMEQSQAIISTTSTVFSSLGGRPRRKKEIDESIFAFPTIDDGCGCVPWGKQQQIDLWEHETVTTNSSSDNNSKESYSSSDSSTAISAPTLLSNSSISTGSSYEMS